MSDVLLTAEHDGTRVQLRPGDVLRLRLEEVSGSGFRWALESDVEPQLVLLGWHYGSGSGAVGGGGYREVALRAQEPGSTRLGLKLWREWEGDGSVQRRISAHVDVG